MIEIKAHYNHTIQILLDLYNRDLLSNVERIEYDVEYGFNAQIIYKNGSQRFIHGASVDINTSAATRIATDKLYAKIYMKHHNFKTPNAEVFFTERKLGSIRGYLTTYNIVENRTIDEVISFIESKTGYPCFVKSNEGSRGVNVYKCYDSADVSYALEQLSSNCVDTIIVEEEFTMPEYRVVIYEGQCIACYSKVALSITGDGESTVDTLITKTQKAMIERGRRIDLLNLNPRIDSQLQRLKLSRSAIISDQQNVQLLDVANLSAGGLLEDFSDKIHEKWRDLCIDLSHKMNMKLTGIDFMCEDIENPNSDYAIIEYNAAPSLRNYASLGDKQEQIVRNLYLSIYNQPN